MATFNLGKLRLLRLVPNSLVPLDYAALTGYVHSVLGPFTPGLSFADCLPSIWAKGVHSVEFAPGQCHSENDGVTEKTVAFARVGSWAIQNGLEFSPVWVYCDRAVAHHSGDALYRRLTRIICHEVCHCFNVGHSNDPKDLMYHEILDTPYTISPLTQRILKTYLS